MASSAAHIGVPLKPSTISWRLSDRLDHEEFGGAAWVAGAMNS